MRIKPSVKRTVTLGKRSNKDNQARASGRQTFDSIASVAIFDSSTVLSELLPSVAAFGLHALALLWSPSSTANITEADAFSVSRT